jgi:hypothetical protein
MAQRPRFNTNDLVWHRKLGLFRVSSVERANVVGCDWMLHLSPVGDDGASQEAGGIVAPHNDSALSKGSEKLIGTKPSPMSWAF